jgi:hypothetical protein
MTESSADNSAFFPGFFHISMNVARHSQILVLKLHSYILVPQWFDNTRQ